MLAEYKKLTHDGQITISTGSSRRELKWKPKELAWSVLVDRLNRPRRTPETLAEYGSLGRAEQDNLKDCGGFVGGTLKGGRRVAGAVGWRVLVTLDADSASLVLLDRLAALPFAACWHSTRKHGVNGQIRIRLVIPLARPVDPDQYQAVARLIASDLGLELFDQTTFAPERLMYWPSCSSDSEFLHGFRDAAWLDPDEVLARYENWRDPSTWPAHPGAEHHVRAHAARVGDPRAKPGLVGAFCRAFSIEQAIAEFLGDVYTPGPGTGRYTFRGGSTAGGLVLYDGLWCYSHHGTDPVSGRLCNAWDLVRLHRHGLEDEGATEGTPVNRLPSTLSMSEWARGLGPVKADLLAGMRDEFGAPVVEVTEEGWLDQLELDRKGRLVQKRENYRKILTCDPQLAGRICRNDFTESLCIRGKVPWRDGGQESRWTDDDDAHLRSYLELSYPLTPAGHLLEDALAVVRAANRFHPVRSYLHSVRWDGKERVDRLLTDTLGAEDSQYTQAVSRKILAAAVARVMVPGTKFDYMPLLIGPQGIGKSTLFRILGGEWFSDSLDTIEGKDGAEQLRGVWIIEMAEMIPTRRADNNQSKQFLTRTSDRYRPPYGRHVIEYPRQCVFVATTNTHTPLMDSTGNRRYWPVLVEKVVRGVAEWRDRIEAERDQIWAEAVILYDMREQLYPSAEMGAQALKHQEAHRADDGMMARIEQWLAVKIPEGWHGWPEQQQQRYLSGNYYYDGPMVQRDRTCAREAWVMALKGLESNFTRVRAAEVNDALRALGWVEKTGILVGNFGRGRGFARP